MRFRHRVDAGQQLTKKLEKYKSKEVVVLALPRGGVVLGKVIAEGLGVPLDLVVVRKIGHPWSPEYAIGAVTEQGKPMWNENERTLIDKSSANLPAQAGRNLSDLVAKEREEARRRRIMYRGNRMPLDLKGKAVILVDDGIATGLTFKKAIEEVRSRRPRKLIAAVPVIPGEAVAEFEKLVNELVVLEAPDDYLGAVGAYYDRFEQVSDEEVVELVNG